MEYDRIYKRPSLFIEREAMNRCRNEKNRIDRTWAQWTIGFQMFFELFNGIEEIFASTTMALNRTFGAETRIDLLLLFRQKRIGGEFDMLQTIR